MEQKLDTFLIVICDEEMEQGRMAFRLQRESRSECLRSMVLCNACNIV